MTDGWRRMLTEPNLSAIDVHAFLNQAVSMQARAALPEPSSFNHALPLSSQEATIQRGGSPARRAPSPSLPPQLLPTASPRVSIGPPMHGSTAAHPDTSLPHVSDGGAPLVEPKGDASGGAGSALAAVVTSPRGERHVSHGDDGVTPEIDDLRHSLVEALRDAGEWQRVAREATAEVAALEIEAAARTSEAPDCCT